MTMHSFADFPDYIIAADIGSLADFTAICTFEQQIWLSAQTQARKQIDMVGEDHWASPVNSPGNLPHHFRMIAGREGLPPQVPLLLTELTRLPLGTGYPAI